MTSPRHLEVVSARRRAGDASTGSAPPAFEAALPGRKIRVSTKPATAIPAATTSETSIPWTKAVRTDASNGAEPSCWATANPPKRLSLTTLACRWKPRKMQLSLIGGEEHAAQDRRPERPSHLLESLHHCGSHPAALL